MQHRERGSPQYPWMRAKSEPLTEYQLRSNRALGTGDGQRQVECTLVGSEDIRFAALASWIRKLAVQGTLWLIMFGFGAHEHH